jgi:hypothetical protein
MITLLMQCPLMVEPTGAHNDCIWARSSHWNFFTETPHAGRYFLPKGGTPMLTIYNSAYMKRVLSRPIDPDLKTILLNRLELLAELSDWDLGELAHFIIVQPGDRKAAIEEALVSGTNYSTSHLC